MSSYIKLGIVMALAALACSQLSSARTRLVQRDGDSSGLTGQSVNAFGRIHSGNARWDPPAANSETIVVDEGPGLDQGCVYEGTPIEIPFEITRALGTDPTKLAEQQLLGQSAYILMPAYDVDYVAGERDRVVINNNVILGDNADLFLQGSGEIWHMNVFEVPIEFLNFPELPADPNGTPVPAQNTISIEVDIGGDAPRWCTDVDWVAIYFEVAPPVVMAHGLAAGPWAFDGTYLPFLTDGCGLPASVADFRFEGFANQSIQTNADILQVEIERLKRRTGSDSVTVLAHSMGGIVARHYAETHDDIDQIIQIGSPNVGSPIADLGVSVLLGVYALDTSDDYLMEHFPELQRFNGPGIFEMTTGHMAQYYNRFHGRNSNTRPGRTRAQRVSSLAGFATTPLLGCDYADPLARDDISKARWGGSLLFTVTGEINDSAVTRWSVWGEVEQLVSRFGVGFVTDRKVVYADSSCQLRAVHDFLVRRTHPQIGVEFPATRATVMEWLRDFRTLPSPVPERSLERKPKSTVVTDTSMEPAHKSTVEPMQWRSTVGGGSELVVGQTAIYSVPVSQAGPATFIVAYGSGEVDVELTSPSGEIITPASPSAEYVDGRIPVLDQPAILYRLPFAERGAWTVTVHATGATSGDGKVGVFVLGQSGAPEGNVSAALETEVDPTTVRPGDPVTFRAHLVNGNGPLLGATNVEASVVMLAPGLENQTRVTLHDDGLDGDEIALDGTFTGSSVQTQSQGQYRLLWSVEGNLPDSTPFSLSDVGELTVSARQGGVSPGGITEFRSDLNGNGLYETLDFAVPVSVEVAGSYRLFGRLRDSAGNELTASSVSDVQVGSSDLILRFQGPVLYENAVDGPYILGDIGLEALTQDAPDTPVHLLPGDQHESLPYAVAEFEHDTNVRETGVFEARGVDTSGNGKFDVLQTDIGLEVPVPGIYVVSAILTDTSGAFVGSVSSFQAFETGDQVARLEFPGKELYFHPVDGPLVLRGFAMYGSDLPSYFSTQLYETQPFFAEQFDCPLSQPEFIGGGRSVTLAVPSGQTSAVVDFEEPEFRYCTPFTIACNPESGSVFPLGSTLVTCTISATDGSSATWPIFVSVVEQCIAFAIDDPASTLLPPATVGEPYGGVEISTTGGGYPVEVTATGLPPGMSFAAGRPTGTPTQSGGYILAVTATDSYGCTTTRDYALNVSCEGIELSPGELPAAAVGVPYSVAVSATGGDAPYSYIVRTYQDTLPAGLTFTNGTLAGTPTQGGRFKFAVQATDESGCLTVRDYTLNVVCAELAIGPDVLPGGTVGVTYPGVVFSSSGTAPFTYLAGFLPPGMSVEDGALVGTPSQSGTFNPVIHVTDAKGCTGTRTYSLAVNRTPSARCRNVTVAAGPGCVANANVDNGSSDPDGDPFTVTQSPSGPYPLGVTAVVLTVTDSHGATSQCNATVTVLDSIAPIFPVAPSAVDVRATPGSSSATVSFPTPNATDGCGVVAVSCVPASGSEFPLGQTSVTCTAIDLGGNQATASFAVYVRNSGDCLGSGSSNGLWYEASSNGANAQYATFSWQPSSPTGSYLDSVAGDWNGDGVDTVGMVYASTSVGGNTLANVYLRNTNSAGGVDQQYTVTLPSNSGASYVPLAGDWNGDGVSTLGFYRPSTGVFYLRNSNTSGAPDVTFAFGAANSIPLRGDWDGNGTDSVGIYVASTFTFSARNTNSAGAADFTLTFSAATATSSPISGDWDGDRVDTLGFIGSISGYPGNIHLHVANAVAPPVNNFYLYLGNGRMFSGNWDGNGLPYVRTVSPQTCVAGQSNLLVSFTGVDLGTVTSVTVTPAEGVTVSSLSVDAGLVTARFSIALDAQVGLRTVRLGTPSGNSNSVPIVVRAPGGVGETDTIGFVDVNSGSWLLRNSNTPGPASTVFYYSPNGPTLTPLRGDWNGDGIDTPGWFDPATNTFYLRNSNSAGPADITVTFNVSGLPRTPITGDWNGDGTDTVGIFETATGKFFLRNTNSPSSSQISFVFKPVLFGTISPVAGDWDGSGADSIGVYNAATGTFYLRNSNSAGATDVQVQYGSSPSTFKPMVGDWNGDRTVTLGLYDPVTGAFFLRNSNSPGGADLVFTFGVGGSAIVPLVGDWDALGTP